MITNPRNALPLKRSLAPLLALGCPSNLRSLVDSDGASNHLELPLLPFADQLLTYHQEPVEGLVVLESLSELCVERPVWVMKVYSSRSLEEI